MANYGPDWPQRREQALERDDYTCQNCDEPTNTVHHKRYAPKGETVELEALVSLCQSCHHDEHRRPRTADPQPVKSVRIDDDQQAYLDQRNVNLSAFVRDCLADHIHSTTLGRCDRCGLYVSLGGGGSLIQGGTPAGEEMGLGTDEDAILCEEHEDRLIDHMRDIDAGIREPDSDLWSRFNQEASQ